MRDAPTDNPSLSRVPNIPRGQEARINAPKEVTTPAATGHVVHPYPIKSSAGIQQSCCCRLVNSNSNQQSAGSHSLGAVFIHQIRYD